MDRLIEGIYFFEVNTKYIPLSVLKTSKLPRVRSKNSDVFNSRDEIYLVFTKNVNSLFLSYFYRLHAMSHPLKKVVLNMKNEKNSKPK